MKGERFSVAGWFGPIRRDGLDWYKLGSATVGDLDAWAAAGSGSDRYLELVPSECPAADSDLTTVIGMDSDWDRLACFGDRSLTLEGTVRVLALAGPGHPWNPGHAALAVGSAHAIGECPIRLPGVAHDDQAGPVGILGLELRHAEELNVDVLALERDDWVRGATGSRSW